MFLPENQNSKTFASLALVMLISASTGLLLMYKIREDVTHSEKLSAERLDINAYEALYVKKQLRKQQVPIASQN